MESLKELYRIGSGPSSSHTMGPKRAAERFAERCRDVDAYRVTLYGSLAATGKGHLTDVAILSVLEPAAPTRIVWKPEVVLPFHPNGMLFEGLKGDEVVDSWTIYSVGGGALANEASRLETPRSIYPLSTISEIKEWCYHEGKTFWEYVSDCEGPEIWDYLDTVWETMCATIQRGLNNDGVLPGGLKVARKASTYWVKSKSYTDSLSSRAKIYAYALATSEENASGGTVVTAPTCGSSGVMPAVLYHLSTSRNFLRIRILPRPDFSATSPRPTPPFPVPRSAARARSAWPAPWLPPPRASSSAEPLRRSNTPPRWVSNTTWASRATPCADWCRSPASSATPSPRPGPSTPTPTPRSPTARTW